MYNFRSEGREFNSNRCLIIADGFYEFTGTEGPQEETEGQMALHQKDEPIFCIAGIWREMPGSAKPSPC